MCDMNMYLRASGGRNEGGQVRIGNDIISQYFLNVTCEIANSPK